MSTFSYSKAVAIGNKVHFLQDDVLNFYRPKTEKKLWKQEEITTDMMLDEQNDSAIFIENLPSHARVCINVIMITERVKGHVNVLNKKLNSNLKSGFVLGSC